jgi:hypothetical protein
MDHISLKAPDAARAGELAFALAAAKTQAGRGQPPAYFVR